MHCVKSVRIRSYSGPYFHAFTLNTDQNNSEYGHFSRSDTDGNTLSASSPDVHHQLKF